MFRLAKSWLGLLTAYFAAITAALIAFQKLPKPLDTAPLWLRVTGLSLLPAIAVLFQVIPDWLDRRRNQRLTEIEGHLEKGYFQLAAREDESSFTRADGIHEEILGWIERCTSRLLYLTGLSGSGKTSIVSACIAPRLERNGTVVIRLRGYQDPIKSLQQELLSPGVIWLKPSDDTGEIVALVDRASRYLRPKRLLIIFDQFEEFVILEDPESRKPFEHFISSVLSRPDAGVRLLLVFRSDYIGLIEKLAVPKLKQNTNWKEVPPFTESVAREFAMGSGLKVRDELLRDVLREAAEIEQTKGIIRPVTINLCGLVLGRFSSGLPSEFRPGGMIRGFLRETIQLREIREVAPAVMPHLITGHLTKQPRSIAQLAAATANDPEVIRGCMRILGRSDRAIVRPLDPEQTTWEISHDFLVPLLDSIVARWRISLWRRSRSWTPWLVAAIMLMVISVVSVTNWLRDPILDLEDLGWTIHRANNMLELTYSGNPSKASVKALARLSLPTKMILKETTDLQAFSNEKKIRTLNSLDLSYTAVQDLSPLKDLKCLNSLDLINTEIHDLAPLKDLINLNSLDLINTKVQDLSPLKDLKSLNSLDLMGTKVRDLSPLRGLQRLNSLDLINTDVEDLSPLEGLKSLNSLNLSYTKVQDLTPLKDLKSLYSLDLSYTKVQEISALKGLTGLGSLDLANSLVRNLTPLKDLKRLNSLDLTNTDVRDFSSLKDLAQLKVVK